MLDCVIPSWSTRRPNPDLSLPSQQGSSAEDTPSSTTQPSPTINLTREYTLAIQTSSYKEIWSRIHPSDPSYEDSELGEREAHEEQQRLAHVLNPHRECVQEALQHAKPTTLTRLVSDYFDHSENTSHLCLLLHDSVCQARLIYHDIHNLLQILPLDSDPYCLTQSQCERTFDIFLQFDRRDNPLRPDSHNIRDIRHCFSQLKLQLDRRLSKSRSRIRTLRSTTTCSASCFIGPLLRLLIPSKITKKEMAHLAQLDAAAKGTYVLHRLDTIDRLVESLYTAVEGDKGLIRLGLERGRDRHLIHGIAKQLQKNHRNFLDHFTDLEVQICLCFAAINRDRSLLLEEIHLNS